MTTEKQQLGAYGEELIRKRCPCPKCKRSKTLVRLPPNFKCADLICDFCGFLAQVKSTTTKNIDRLPAKILGAAWRPQKERMDAAIYFPLYLVLAPKDRMNSAAYYLSADLQDPDLFIQRKPLSSSARRAGWQGFYYDIEKVQDRMVKLF